MKIGVEPKNEKQIHEVELEFDAAERNQRESSARRIQGIARARTAKKEMAKRRDLKKQRDNLPAQDSHGHANPATIRVFNTHPVIHIHHHGNYY